MGQTSRKVKIVVVTGDITAQEVDAIVNPANSSMIMGGGVAGAIRRSGGKQIEDEAIRNAPVSVGEAVATGAGRLKAGHVIHAPTMRRPAMRIDTENVKLAVRGALECAERLSIQSIAFPGMGTGVGGLGLDEAATAMMEEIKTHIDQGTSLKEIVLVGFSASAAQTFEKAVDIFKRALGQSVLDLSYRGQGKTRGLLRIVVNRFGIVVLQKTWLPISDRF